MFADIVMKLVLHSLQTSKAIVGTDSLTENETPQANAVKVDNFVSFRCCVCDDMSIA